MIAHEIWAYFDTGWNIRFSDTPRWGMDQQLGTQIFGPGNAMIFDVTNDPISLLFLSLDLDPPNVAPALEAMAAAASRDQRVKKLQSVGGAGGNDQNTLRTVHMVLSCVNAWVGGFEHVLPWGS